MIQSQSFAVFALLCFGSALAVADVLPSAKPASVWRSASVGDDPAGSWLNYAEAVMPGHAVTYMNATWTVPAYPELPFGSNAPGFWYGVESNDDKVLIQPILAFGDGLPYYTIFNGEFNWINGEWLPSSAVTVYPGDKIFSSITLLPQLKKYELRIENAKTKKGVTTRYDVFEGKTFDRVYFVLEHQPDACAAYPKSNEVVFENINIEWSGKLNRSPNWSAHAKVPACNSKCTIVSPTSVKFTWES